MISLVRSQVAPSQAKAEARVSLAPPGRVLVTSLSLRRKPGALR